MKPLKRVKEDLYHYENGKRIEGFSPYLDGNCSGLKGNCSGLKGDCSGLRGDLDKITDNKRKENSDISFYVE